MSKEHRRVLGVAQTLRLQFILGIIVVVLFGFTRHNTNSVISAALGVSIAMLATFTYIKVAFSAGMVLYPKDAYVRHKKAMVYRFVINLLLFAIVFAFYRTCDALALLVAYCVTFCAYWLALVTKQR